jgi:NAD(P) transhydrogenase subunit beta
MHMTAVPQRTALSHAFGALAAALVGTAEYLQQMPDIHPVTMAVLAAEMILGYLTFTGSLVAFGKLQEILPGSPLIYPGRNAIALGSVVAALALAVALVIDPGNSMLMWAMCGVALLFGILLVMGIGGADMPTVIAILNSYAGLSAAGLGFVLNNKLLIVAGALDGASGFILAILMCRAMNRSFTNVLFGGVGAAVAAGGGEQRERQAQVYTPDDIATVLENASRVIIAPGYGLAVARAQHAAKELADVLTARGCEVSFAIHPVAGRMPGHMNVLLAEAEVAYENLLEMEQVNPLFPEADAAIILGANDVTNPAARHNKSSPLYGMPILDCDKARSVVFCKRSLGVGFAGVDNELFYDPKTMMVLGDAKDTLLAMIKAMRGGGLGH